MRRAGVLLFAAAAACHRGSSAGHEAGVAAGAAPPPPPAECAETSREVAPGLRVERVRAPVASPVAIGDRCITIVRAEPARWELRLMQGRDNGGERTADEWSARFGLAAVINASMYQSNGRSVGLMVDGEHAGNPSDNSKYGGFFAFGPTRDGLPPAAGFGRDCAGFDLAAIKRDYRAVVQNYRLLDCAGQPVTWQDAKAFSAAVVGLDRQGRVAFVHSRTPYTMTQLARMLAAPPFELTFAMHTEGGPEASLFVHAGDFTAREIGSYETGFFTRDDHASFTPLPNVLGLVQRD
ncbi:MAG TPA: phosphodiester glycosidase family protein [Polyangiaceae bacterium]|nr:phosphodiester glycosidase family protein [Polyangiaceae bacterium]